MSSKTTIRSGFRGFSLGLGLLLAAQVEAAIPVAERDALIALYTSANGDSWTDNTNWNGPPGSECTWFGVFCDAAQTFVDRLSLGHNGLNGSIPAELGNLANLTELSLNSNALAGTIPLELAGLTDLEILSLGRNALSGPIPVGLNALTDLTLLILNHNQLTGPVPPDLAGLINLEVLDLGNNDLSGTIPADLGSLASLVSLGLNDNLLTGPIPPELADLTQLQWLILRNNGLSGALPSELGHLANLTILDLSGNDFIGTIPTALGDLVDLSTLNLASNSLSGSIPLELTTLADLTRLSLDANDLSGQVPPELEQLINLSILTLTSNALSGEIPAQLGNLGNLTNLQLTNNNLDGPIPPQLSSLSNLKVLGLGMNQLTGSIPPELGSLTDLVTLTLAENALNGPLPPELGNLAKLAVLDLGQNQVTGPIPAELGALNNLEVLVLSHNRLSGAIPQEVGDLTALESLHLLSNQFSGEVPITFLNLTNLLQNRLDLRYNMLFSNDPALSAFLTSKQADWEITQTIAPADVAAAAATPTSVDLSWTPIVFTGMPGGYRVSHSTTSGGPYTSFGLTADKTVSGLTVTGLEPATTYYFIVETQTDAHFNNQNTLVSDPSGDVSATLPIANTPPNADAGPAQNIQCGCPGGVAVTLDGTASFDPDGDDLTYLWTAAGITFDDPTSPMPTATFPVGTTAVTLVVNDGSVDSSPDAVAVTVSTAAFTEILTPLAGVTQSSIDWGDYDNDGDLDIVLSGRNVNNAGITKVYRNDGVNVDGIFTDIEAPLVSSQTGSVTWGDYDNDGDLDFLLTGGHFGSNIFFSKVYRNDGNDTFVDIDAGLAGVGNSTAAWGDYDNDGDLDIVLAGETVDAVGITKIYRNERGDGESSGVFTDVEADLVGVNRASLVWGDYDNDGDLDLLLTGLGNGGIFHSKIYRYDGDGIFIDVDAGLIELITSSAAWGDYDNDGDLDILLTGGTCCSRHAEVYRNDGNDTFTDIEVDLEGVVRSSAKWGDYDNDGDLDILLAGDLLFPDLITKVFRNDGNDVFTDLDAGLIGVRFGSVAWGDYDNDGDLDVLVTGESITGIIAKLYRNNNTANSAPAAPTNLAAVVAGDSAELSWAPGSDAQTPTAALTYNLRIGRTPGGSEAFSPMADGSTGYRRVVALGNANHNLDWTIEGLPPGEYFWSVQAIDGAYAGSAFAGEGQFSIAGGNNPPIADAGPDQNIVCSCPDGTAVTLDGTASFDPDGDDLTYLWTAAGITFDDPTSPMPTATFPVGTTAVTLVVNDGTVDSSPDTVLVTIEESGIAPPALRVLDAATAAGEIVDVGIELTGSEHDIAALAFSIDYDETCLDFDPTDANDDGLPDAINFQVPAAFSVTVFPDLGDPDGEIDVLIFNIPPINTLADGVLSTITFQTTCTPTGNETLLAPVRFSSGPPPSFGNTGGQSVPGLAFDGAVSILDGQRGNCNGDDDGVNAGDLSACGLELFDGDGSFWLDVPGGTFEGSPVGCDANADTKVDAGDVSRKGLLIFAPAPMDPPTDVPGGTAGVPELSIPMTLPVEPGGTVIVPVRFESHGHAINSLVFSLDFDQAKLSFDDTDPDAVRFFGIDTSVQSVSFQPEDEGGELDFIIADLGSDPQLLADGLLVEIELQVLIPDDVLASAVVFSRDPQASFGDVAGSSVPGWAGEIPFEDGFETGDTSAWSKTVQ